ncbi:MAG: hypothetical protein Q6373_022935 [Candidatus Sigynarchaeota archaeon]
MSQNFTPLSSQLGITGSSYRLQLGKVGNSWAARILKGNEVVVSTTFNELNGNLIVGFVMQETAIPNLNPYQIMKTVQFLTKEAQGNELRAKSAGIPAPGPEVQERTQAAAAAIAQKATAPSPARAPVDTALASDEDTRASYRVVPGARKEVPVEQPAAAATSVNWGETVTIAKNRQLKPIPSAESGASAAPGQAVAKSETPAATPSPGAVRTSPPAAIPAAEAHQKSGIEERVAKIEASIARIEARLAKIEEKLG